MSVTGLWFRLWSRAFVIYQAQLCISLIALAILAIAAISRSNPLFLEWLNSGAAFYDPPRAYIGLALLTYQLSYFNILPLYVALLLLAPPMIGLALWSKRGALAASFTLYVVALATGLRLPSWPSEDQWYFNPLCWQVLLVLGFVAAESADEHEVSRGRPALGSFRNCGIDCGGCGDLAAISSGPCLGPQAARLFSV